MLRNVNSQTNVKIDINYVIDNQNMQEHNNNKELGIFVFESDIFSIREDPNLRHRCPLGRREIIVLKSKFLHIIIGAVCVLCGEKPFKW